MWFVFAMLAALFWGVTYFFEEHVYKHISVLTTLTVTFLASGAVFAILSIATGLFQKDVATLASSNRALGMLIVVAVASMIAELCIGFSISQKNATISGLVEISYPLFAALAGYLLIRENNLSIPTMLGAILIFSGVGVIYAFNR